MADTETTTGYCVPIDETDPDIENTASLEVPLEGKYASTSANNSLIRTVLNFTVFIFIIGLAFITMPFAYSMFITNMIKDAVSLDTNKQGLYNPDAGSKIAALGGADILTIVSIVFICILFVMDGVSNHTSGAVYGLYLIIFSIIAIGRIQLLKMDEEGFLKDLTGQTGQKFESAAFNDKFGAALSNFLYIFLQGRNFTEYVYGPLIFGVLYSISVVVIVFGIGASSSSQLYYSLMSLPICLYLTVLFKYLITTHLSN